MSPKHFSKKQNTFFYFGIMPNILRQNYYKKNPKKILPEINCENVFMQNDANFTPKLKVVATFGKIEIRSLLESCRKFDSEQ